MRQVSRTNIGPEDPASPVMRSMWCNVLVSVCTLSRSALTLFSVSTSVCSR